MNSAISKDEESIRILNKLYLEFMQQLFKSSKTKWRSLGLTMGAASIIENLNVSEIETLAGCGCLLFKSEFSTAVTDVEEGSLVHSLLTDFKLTLSSVLLEVIAEGRSDLRFRFGLSDGASEYIREMPRTQMLDVVKNTALYSKPTETSTSKRFWSDLVGAARSGDSKELILSRINFSTRLA